MSTSRRMIETPCSRAALRAVAPLSNIRGSSPIALADSASRIPPSSSSSAMIAIRGYAPRIRHAVARICRSLNASSSFGNAPLSAPKTLSERATSLVLHACSSSDMPREKLSAPTFAAADFILWHTAAACSKAPALRNSRIWASPVCHSRQTVLQVWRRDPGALGAYGAGPRRRRYRRLPCRRSEPARFQAAVPFSAIGTQRSRSWRKPRRCRACSICRPCQPASMLRDRRSHHSPSAPR